MFRLPKILLAFSFWLLLFTFSVPAFAAPPQSCSADEPNEIIPSCVTCGDTLFCYGTDYDACTSDPIPSGCQPQPKDPLDFSCSPDNFPGGTLVYNGETFTVPNWVYYCNDNLWGCNNKACKGLGAPSVIDISYGQDVWGEDIPIKRKATKDSKGNLSLNLDVDVAPRQGEELKFPDLSWLASLTERALPFQLPQKFAETLSIPDDTLLGAIYHPTCEVREGGQVISGGIKTGTATGKAEITTPSFWTKLLGTTKLGQAIAVPGFSSTSTLVLPSPSPLPSDEEGNAPLGDCPRPPGASGETLATKSEKETIIVANLFDWLGQIIEDFANWLAGKQTVEVTVIAKPKKLMPGEDAFARQTIEEAGFLRSFCPKGLCPEEESEKDKTPYRISDQPEEEIGLEFKKVCGARAAASLLIDSLFPASFGDQSREECE